MNRKERRTRGKDILKRINTLQNSPVFKEADLKDIPPDVVEQLTKGECKNKVLQKKYNTYARLLDEMASLKRNG